MYLLRFFFQTSNSVCKTNFLKLAEFGAAVSEADKADSETDEEMTPLSLLDATVKPHCFIIFGTTIIPDSGTNFTLVGTFYSMTQLSTHTVAHSTRPSFRPKTNNQPTKKFLSLEIT